MGKLIDETKNTNRRAALQAAAELLAERIEKSAASGSGTLAQEVAQYRQTMAEIAALPAAELPKGGGKVVSADEARARREARRADAEAESAAKPSRRKRG